VRRVSWTRKVFLQPFGNRSGGVDRESKGCHGCVKRVVGDSHGARRRLSWFPLRISMRDVCSLEGKNEYDGLVL